MRRSGHQVWAPDTSRTEDKTVKCEICDQEFANSVELEKHKEREHPMGDDENELEKPDLLEEQEQPAPIVPGKI